MDPDSCFPEESIIKTNTIVCERKQTIEKIINLVNQHKTLLIRSPPFTGKTSLAYLLTEHLQKFKKVFSLNFLRMIIDETLTIQDLFQMNTGKAYMAWNEEDVYFILDEVRT